MTAKASGGSRNSARRMARDAASADETLNPVEALRRADVQGAARSRREKFRRAFKGLNQDLSDAPDDDPLAALAFRHRKKRS